MAMCCRPVAPPLQEDLALGNGLWQTWLQAQPPHVGPTIYLPGRQPPHFIQWDDHL